MNRTLRIVIGIALVIALAGAAVFAYILLDGGDGTASQVISAPTLAPENTRIAVVATVGATDEPTAAATAETIIDVTDEAPVAALTDEPAATEEAPVVNALASERDVPSEAITFSIVPEESLVSFSLDEDLRGERVTVVGTTDQVAGQIRVNFDNPSASEMGVIRINVRTLATDSGNRDRATRSQITLADEAEYEFSDFVPTAITGLPETIALGEAVEFQIVGDLTLRGITQSVTFETTVTPVSQTRLEGIATTTIQRAMYEMNIPNVPFVANVSEDVILSIEFVATAG